MKNIKRPFATLGAGALLAVSLTACGGAAPTDASVEDFCDAVSFENVDISGVSEGDFDGIAESVAEWATKMTETGTPEDIPDDAREGFEVMVDQVADLDADTLESAFEADDDPIEDQLSDDDREKFEAFEEYESETC